MPDPVPPPSAPTPPATPPPQEASTDAMVPGLMRRLLADVPAEDTSPEPAKPPEPQPPEAPKPPEPKPPEPAKPTEPAPIGLRKKQPVRPPLPTGSAPAPQAPAPTPSAAAPSAPSGDWEKDLPEDERDMLADAREVEKLMPVQYKGLTARTEKFLKENRAWMQKPEFDENDPAYRAWVTKNAPQVAPKHQREIQETRITNRLRGENDVKHQDLQQQLFERDEEPKLTQRAQKMYAESIRAALPTEVMDAITKDGYEVASKRYADELEVAQNIVVAATEDIKEFIRLNTKNPTTGRYLSAFAENAQHPKYAQHQRLMAMVDGVCAEFQQTAPGNEQLKNGKWFVTREEWDKLPATQRGQYWTFNNDQIIDRARTGLKTNVANAIKARVEGIRARGWERKAPATPPPATPPPVPPATPPAPPRGAPIPGGSSAPSGEAVDPVAKTIFTNLTRS